jgi:hypothetical protein
MATETVLVTLPQKAAAPRMEYIPLNYIRWVAPKAFKIMNKKAA